MVAKACKCGGRIEKRNGRSVCDRCGPVATYSKAAGPNLNALSPYHRSPRWRKETAEWKRLHQWCVCCYAMGRVTVARGRRGILVDHIIPAVLLPGGLTGEAFWDHTNWQTLCLDCDLRYKKPLERANQSSPETIVRLWNDLLHQMRCRTAAARRDHVLERIVKDVMGEGDT